MTMGYCGYRESNGVKYWKPNMAALEGELGREIIQHIINTPKPDFTESDARVKAFNERVRKARENGTF